MSGGCLLCALEVGLKQVSQLSIRAGESEYAAGVRRGLVGGYVLGSGLYSSRTLCFDHDRDVNVARKLLSEVADG
jgi:hypothetical protein